MTEKNMKSITLYLKVLNLRKKSIGLRHRFQIYLYESLTHLHCRHRICKK